MNKKWLLIFAGIFLMPTVGAIVIKNPTLVTWIIHEETPDEASARRQREQDEWVKTGQYEAQRFNEHSSEAVIKWYDDQLSKR